MGGQRIWGEGRYISRILGICENVLTNVALVMTFTIMILVTGDTVMRGFFNSPILGVFEITQEYLMVIVVFSGILYAYRQGGFVKVEFVLVRLPNRAKLALNYFSQVCSIMLSVIFLWATISSVLRCIATGDALLTVWNLPLWPAKAIIPVGLFFMALMMVFDLWKVRKGKSG